MANYLGQADCHIKFETCPAKLFIFDVSLKSWRLKIFEELCEMDQDLFSLAALDWDNLFVKHISETWEYLMLWSVCVAGSGRDRTERERGESEMIGKTKKIYFFNLKKSSHCNAFNANLLLHLLPKIFYSVDK